MSEVQTVRGGAGTPGPGPAFVDVVTGDGVAQSVPAEWVGNPIFDKGWTVVEPDDEAPAAAEQAEASEVQLTGPVSDVSPIGAVRDTEADTPAPVKKAAKSRRTNQTGDTESSDDNPPSGEEK